MQVCRWKKEYTQQKPRGVLGVGTMKEQLRLYITNRWWSAKRTFLKRRGSPDTPFWCLYHPPLFPSPGIITLIFWDNSPPWNFVIFFQFKSSSPELWNPLENLWTTRNHPWRFLSESGLCGSGMARFIFLSSCSSHEGVKLLDLVCGPFRLSSASRLSLGLYL